MKSFIFILTLSALVVGCGKNTSGKESEEQVAVDPIESEKGAKEELQGYLNKLRRKERVLSLQRMQVIDREAEAHSRDMSDGRTPYGHYGVGERCARIRRAIGANFCREIVARNQRNARAALDSWMKSAGQMNIIRDPRFSRIGIGVANDREDRIYWTVIFIQQ